MIMIYYDVAFALADGKRGLVLYPLPSIAVDRPPSTHIPAASRLASHTAAGAATTPDWPRLTNPLRPTSPPLASLPTLPDSPLAPGPRSPRLATPSFHPPTFICLARCT